MRIAKRTPFAGKPVITSPSVLGCSPDKPFLYRLSAIGARPITFSVKGLPDGLMLEGQIVSGTPLFGGCYTLTVTAENEEGRAEKEIRLEVFPGNIRRTPLLGFTTWNAFASAVTEEDLNDTALCMEENGLIDYGYHYINLDSSWQGEYGGEFDAIQPCSRFPDLPGTIAKLHKKGYLFGIYSSPFIEPWGCPPDRKSIPGCTLPPADPRFPSNNGGIGTDRREKNNVRQWAAWGVDYLKYDWGPTDPVNADIMRKALDESPRDIAYCITVMAMPDSAEYWRRSAASWRCCPDTDGKWETVKKTADAYLPWQRVSGHGHYIDLDMLAIGKMQTFVCDLTENEMVFDYSLRAFLTVPIQISSKLRQADEFELDLYENEEVIALNQDGLLLAPVLAAADGDLRIYEKKLENGDLALGIFNGTDMTKKVVYTLGEKRTVRDLWRKEDLPLSDRIEVSIEPHAALLYRISR